LALVEEFYHVMHISCNFGIQLILFECQKISVYFPCIIRWRAQNMEE
jgi:hypothetical protein